jgi:hypothetical protein
MVMAALAENMLEPKHMAYLDWLCTLPSERTPTSKIKYAQENGIGLETLRRWEKKPNFRSEWSKRVDEIQGSPERTKNLLDTLYEKGLSGDTRSAELWLKATNRLAPPTVTVSSDRKAAELTDAELDQLVAQMAVRERAARVGENLVDVK